MEKSTEIHHRSTYSRVRMFRNEALMLLLMTVVVLLVYSNTLQGPFILDDLHAILNNPHIRLNSLTLEGLMNAASEHYYSSRPLACISFALNYYFNNYDVMGYHLVNILIHITTGILLYFFTKTTLTISQKQTAMADQSLNPAIISFFTAFIWMVHPVQTQSVNYIVQRMNCLAAMFFVLSFLLYAQGRLAQEKRHRWVLLSCCILSGILALGSKEIAATLPFLILLYEWYFFRDLSLTWLKRNLLLFAAIFFFSCVLAFIFLEGHPIDTIMAKYKNIYFSITQRLLTELRVVIFYISLLLFPHPSRLNLDHDFSISLSWFDPVTTLLSALLILVFIGSAVYMAKKERLLSFCIIWFFCNLVIESSVIGLEIIFEHRTYLPSMMACLLGVVLVFRFIKPKWLDFVVLAGVVVVCCVWTYERNSVWKDDITLWRDCVEKSPEKARPHNSLGYALINKGELSEAMIYLNKALQINPDFDNAHNNLGYVFIIRGKLKEAIKHLNKALQINPDFADAHVNLGTALMKENKTEEAIRHYNEALRVNPFFAEAHINLGIALIMQNRVDEAVRHYIEALKIEPFHADIHNDLGVFLSKQGKTADAVRHYLKALQLNPDYEQAHNNLANLLLTLGRINEAILHYSEALRVNPEYAEAHNNLGVALIRIGKRREAVEHFRKALEIEPEYEKARKNLEMVLKEK